MRNGISVASHFDPAATHRLSPCIVQTHYVRTLNLPVHTDILNRDFQRLIFVP